jgi:Fur family peroxide stress response transcriptional regulator
MANSEINFEQLLSKLRILDYRLTPQRIELVRLITNSKDHPNAAQLFEQVKVILPTISFATVYKTLDLLKELGEVIEISLHEDNHFDPIQPYSHPHLICTKCNTIRDSEMQAPLQTMVNEMQRISGYQIHRQQLIFYGLCPDCQKKIGCESVI